MSDIISIETQHRQIQELEQQVRTLMSERDEVFQMQKDILAQNEANAAATQRREEERQAKGWAIDRAIETIKVTEGEYKSDDVMAIADKFVEYVSIDEAA